MQLVAYGAQDIYLTGNPQITFFKVVYRRHTNFSMETIQQSINGASKLSNGITNGDVTISRNGDLVSKVYVTSSTDGITDGSSLISKVDCEIGGQLIDRHYKEWNQIWEELTTPASKQAGLRCMQNSYTTTHSETGPNSWHIGMVQIPLFFWFCRNPGLALPLIALQYHEVKLKFTWGVTDHTGGVPEVEVWCDYIYLDTDERRRFAQVSHEYLIEQLQKDSFAGTKTTENLNFNHPVKELIWTSADVNVYKDAKLVLNGHDRFAKQKEEYFQLRQPYDYHTNIPGANIAYTNSPPQLPEGKIDTGVRNHNLTVSASKAKIHAVTAGPSNTITFHKDTPNIPIPGDILDIGMTNSSASTNKVSVLVETREDATNSVITVTPDIEAPGAQHPDGPPENYTTDNKLRIYIMARKKGKPDVSNLTSKINVYSFALKPEEHQPSGTCNFSRIDSAQLIFDTANGVAFNVYAVNYNVLRIMSGMGGLAYSN